MSSDDFTPLERPGVPGGVRDQNRRKRVEALERAGLRLFLRHGIAAVSVDQLAQGAKMAKGSFYRYAKSKAVLVARLVAPVEEGISAAFARCRAGLEEARKSDLPPIYMRLAQDLAEIVRAHPDVVRLYLQESRAPAAKDRQSITELAAFVRVGATELTELARGRGLLGTVPAWLSSAVVVGAAEELLLDHLDGTSERDPAEVQMALVSMVLHGIASWAPPSR